MNNEKFGCESCSVWVYEIGSGDLYQELVCTDFFYPKFSYFSVRILSCPVCSQLWISGYYEDFSNRDVTCEWGIRTWKIAPITKCDFEYFKNGNPDKIMDIDKYCDEINEKLI